MLLTVASGFGLTLFTNALLCALEIQWYIRGEIGVKDFKGNFTKEKYSFII